MDYEFFLVEYMEGTKEDLTHEGITHFYLGSNSELHILRATGVNEIIPLHQCKKVSYKYKDPSK
jgi:hypothetical protein